MKKKTTIPSTLERTRLIQRLTKPRRTHPAFGKDNPWSFGGGYKNGGLSADAMTLLRPCFGFDYMGSAEYEFGAVPEGLQKVARLADEGYLGARTTTVDLSTIDPGWEKDAKPGEGEATVYLLCDLRAEQEIVQRIQWIAMEGKKNPHPEWGTGAYLVFKEQALFGKTLLGRPYMEHNGGWLELDNGFMFFSDQLMWQRTAAVFGQETVEES